jgi:hypothetical protein
MYFDPSKPITAEDARILTDLANHEAMRPATELWIAQAKVYIMDATQAQQTSLILTFDPTIQNQAVLFQYLAVTCGYTTFVDNVSNPNTFSIDWASAKRLAVTPPSCSQSNFGYQAN